MKKTTKAKAKKPATVEPDHSDRDPLSLTRKYAPKLVEKHATLLPFYDVLMGAGAGPQPGTKYYDPKEEPYFSVDVQNPQYPNLSYTFRVTEHTVALEHWEAPGDGTMDLVDDPVFMTMEELWDFLRQLPRPAHSFARIHS
jgi:hypothetical protein